MPVRAARAWLHAFATSSASTDRRSLSLSNLARSVRAEFQGRFKVVVFGIIKSSGNLATFGERFPLVAREQLSAQLTRVAALSGTAGGRPERRLDTDGCAYTLEEFREEYGGDAEWERAKPLNEPPQGPPGLGPPPGLYAPKVNVAALASSAAAAAAAAAAAVSSAASSVPPEASPPPSTQLNMVVIGHVDAGKVRRGMLLSSSNLRSSLPPAAQPRCLWIASRHAEHINGSAAPACRQGGCAHDAQI